MRPVAQLSYPVHCSGILNVSDGFYLVPSRLPPVTRLGTGREVQRKDLLRNVFSILLEAQLNSENFSLDSWLQHCPMTVRLKCAAVASF